MREMLDQAGTRAHPFDLKNDDLVKIKILFPENQILFKAAGLEKCQQRSNVRSGLDLHVRISFLKFLVLRTIAGTPYGQDSRGGQAFDQHDRQGRGGEDHVA